MTDREPSKSEQVAALRIARAKAKGGDNANLHRLRPDAPVGGVPPEVKLKDRKGNKLLPLPSGSKPGVSREKRKHPGAEVEPRENKGKVGRRLSSAKRDSGKTRKMPEMRSDDSIKGDASTPRRLLEAIGGDVALLKVSRVGTSLLETSRKRGRPRIGEDRPKPWESLGMSERTFYRRQKEQKK